MLALTAHNVLKTLTLLIAGANLTSMSVACGVARFDWWKIAGAKAAGHRPARRRQQPCFVARRQSTAKARGFVGTRIGRFAQNAAAAAQAARK
jgi:hypothetical protein